MGLFVLRCNCGKMDKNAIGKFCAPTATKIFRRHAKILEISGTA
jgi:hypothetical protein